MVLIAKVRNAVTRNATVQNVEFPIEVIQIAETQSAAIHYEAPSEAVPIAAPLTGVSLSSGFRIAATQFWFRVVIRVAPFSVQNAARNAVSLPASVVQHGPHEVSRMPAP